MASIIITCVPGQGHVAPLLAVARNFVERGDDVRFITGARFAEKISAVGATPISLTGEANIDESLLEQFPERVRPDFPALHAQLQQHPHLTPQWA